MSDEHNKEKQIHRRDVLKWGAVAGAAVAVGASGLGGLAPLFKPAATTSKKNDEKGIVIKSFLLRKAPSRNHNGASDVCVFCGA